MTEMPKPLFVPPIADSTQEHEVKERAIAEAVQQNQNVERSHPPSVSKEDYERELLHEGQKSEIWVREPNGKLTIQKEMYCVDADESEVELTYFEEDGRLGYTFWLPKDRIIKIENG